MQILSIVLFNLLIFSTASGSCLLPLLKRNTQPSHFEDTVDQRNMPSWLKKFQKEQKYLNAQKFVVDIETPYFDDEEAGSAIFPFCLLFVQNCPILVNKSIVSQNQRVKFALDWCKGIVEKLKKQFDIIWQDDQTQNLVKAGILTGDNYIVFVNEVIKKIINYDVYDYSTMAVTIVAELKTQRILIDPNPILKYFDYEMRATLSKLSSEQAFISITEMASSTADAVSNQTMDDGLILDLNNLQMQMRDQIEKEDYQAICFLKAQCFMPDQYSKRIQSDDVLYQKICAAQEQLYHSSVVAYVNKLKTDLQKALCKKQPKRSNIIAKKQYHAKIKNKLKHSFYEKALISQQASYNDLKRRYKDTLKQMKQNHANILETTQNELQAVKNELQSVKNELTIQHENCRKWCKSVAQVRRECFDIYHKLRNELRESQQEGILLGSLYAKVCYEIQKMRQRRVDQANQTEDFYSESLYTEDMSSNQTEVALVDVGPYTHQPYLTLPGMYAAEM